MTGHQVPQLILAPVRSQPPGKFVQGWITPTIRALAQFIGTVTFSQPTGQPQLGDVLAISQRADDLDGFLRSAPVSQPASQLLPSVLIPAFSALGEFPGLIAFGQLIGLPPPRRILRIRAYRKDHRSNLRSNHATPPATQHSPHRQQMLTPIDRQHMLTVMSRPGIEPFSPDAVSVFATALAHAHRLGHRHLGTEHLLLAVASADHPTGTILRDHGVTPERVEQEIRAGLFGGLDRDALAAIGIDLDAVRARAEESFEPEALARAGQAVPRKRPARLSWHRRPQVLALLMRRWHRRRAAAGEPIPLRAATGLWRGDHGARVFVPFTPSARQGLLSIRRAVRDQCNAGPDVEHIALALISMTDGPVPAILSSLAVPPLALRTAILKGYRRAS